MKFPRGNLEGLVIAPAVHTAGADLDHQGVSEGILSRTIAPLELGGGQSAVACHIDPLGGGIKVAGLIGPEIPIPQGAGELVPVRGGDDALPEQAVADVQPGGQLLRRLHDLGIGLPHGEFQKPQHHHILALFVTGKQGEALDQVDSINAPLDAQRFAVGGGQGLICPDGVGKAVKMGRIQRPFPQVVHHVELEHRPHLISMPPWAGLLGCS